MATITQAGLASLLEVTGPAGAADRIELRLPVTITRRGHELRMAIAARTTAPTRDGRLLALPLKAEEARQMLLVDGQELRPGSPVARSI